MSYEKKKLKKIKNEASVAAQHLKLKYHNPLFV